MPSNIWSIFSGRNDSSPSRYFPIMHWMVLSVIFLVSTCHADDYASYNKAEIMKQAEDNIRWLRQAKEQVEREQRKNSLAALTDLMIKDSFDSQLMSKMDILYDNQTDLNRELKFVPQVFNCGKEFDIFKVLELAKAHRNITTEQPPCLVDVEDNMCTTKKANGGPNPNKLMRNTAAPQSRDPATNGAHAYAVQAAISTKLPQRYPAVEKRTEPAALRQPSANPQTKTAKLKPQTKEKPSPLGKDLRVKLAPNYLQEHFESKGFISPVVGYRQWEAEPLLSDVRFGENPHQSEELPQNWYPAQFAQNEAQQYSSIENQNDNDAQVELHEPRASKLDAPPESLQPQVKSAQSPVIQVVSQQTQRVESAPSQVVQQPPVQNVEKSLQKQSGLEPTPNDVRNSVGQRDPNVALIDKTKQELEKNVSSSITKTQQLPQQLMNLGKQPPLHQSLIQSQFSEQQKHANQAKLQNLEKLTQQQPQLLEIDVKQQSQSLGKRNQQLTIEQQLQTGEQQNNQQLHTTEQQKLQQLQTGERQQLQTGEKQMQQIIQTAGQERNQFSAMEKQNPQSQTIENQPPSMSAVTDSDRYQPLMEVVPGSQQQAAQKISYGASDRQQILKQQTLFPTRIEENQQSGKMIGNTIKDTSAEQAAQKPDSQSVPKLPSEASNKGLSEGNNNKLLNSNSDKTMLSAPINVMVMEPNLNFSNGDPTSKVNILPENIPATAYFWGYTMANTPKLQNRDALKTEQNKAASGTNKLESSDIPGNIQENPKEDYVYYQDQD